MRVQRSHATHMASQLALSLPLCLLKDLLSTLITSLLCSLLLHLFCPLLRIFSSNRYSTHEDASYQCSLFKGIVCHERRHPVLHRFKYSVHYAFVNLDCPPPWFLTSAAASRHMTAAEARNVAGTTGPVHLLTVPTSVGYEQNPLSVYYCYTNDGYPDGRVMKCIAEVTNTPWAERVIFTFEPRGDIVAKPLHVSPFMDMLGSWNIHASIPGRELSLTIRVEHPEFGRYFTAILQAERVEWSVRNPEVFLWLMPHKVTFGIYWQAFMLWWKGVVFQSHPKYASEVDYRKCAIERDIELRSHSGKGLRENELAQVSDTLSATSTVKETESRKQRFCAWQEAHWPWA